MSSTRPRIVASASFASDHGASAHEIISVIDFFSLPKL